MGLSLIYYTHPDESSLKFRTEAGLGAVYSRFYYGYTLTILIKDFWTVSGNVFGVNLAIPAKKSMYP